MDVTANNFWSLLPTTMLIIASSDYIALDMELTGISVKDDPPHPGTLTMEQAYGRMRTAASTFQAVQVGLTCVRWASES
jgi:poly(A)-specific ribonuclease